MFCAVRNIISNPMMLCDGPVALKYGDETQIQTRGGIYYR